MAKSAIRDALYDLHASLSDMPEAAAYLEAAGHDMVRNVGLFLATGEEENAIVKQPVDTAHDPRFRRYMVNVMAANGEGAPAALRWWRRTIRPMATWSGASSTSPRWARWSPTSC